MIHRAKLSRHAFLRFWQAHSYAGIIAGLLLYVMCLCGTLTLYRHELELWEEPLAQPNAAHYSLDHSLKLLLSVVGPVEPEIWLHLPDDRAAPKFDVRPQASSQWKSYWVDAETSAVVPERERLSSLIYRLHFLWHDATGVWLYYVAGLLAVSMLVALVSGCLIHLKDIAQQFHQFRPFKTARVLWSDMHKVLGVMGLPFQLMYAYTGALLVLTPLILQTFLGPVFQGDLERAEQLAFGVSEPSVDHHAAEAVPLPIDDLIAHARRERPGLKIETLEIVNHGRLDGRVNAWGVVPTVPEQRAHIELAESDGRVLSSELRHDASTSLRRWVQGLHFARFGGRLLRAAFFALGLLSCLALLSGNLVWLARRRSGSFRTFERLTASVGAGTITALGALFFASRVLPVAMPARAAIEELVFFAVFAAAILYGFATRDVAALWWRLLAVASVLLAPVPMLAAGMSQAGLFGTGPSLGVVVGVDLTIQGFSLAILALAAALKRRLSGHSVLHPSLPREAEHV